MIHVINQYVIPAAFSLLPESMRSTEARALLLAIGQQESRFKHRRQIGGPARGFWQFEKAGGVEGVMLHRKTAPLLEEALRTLGYPLGVSSAALHDAIEHNDILAAVFARLLLWTVPTPLPASAQHVEEGWDQYIAGWRPGKPHPETWDEFYQTAWQEVSS